jgi:uncharacterized RDD family membrane protein YckC
MLCPQCGQPAPEGAAFCPACGSQLAPPGDAEPPDEIAGPVHAPAGTLGYAGFWRRAVGLVIDGIVLALIGIPTGLVLAMALPDGSGAATRAARSAVAMATYVLLTWIYFAAMESSPWEATLGKRAIGLRVTDSSGARLRFRRASARWFAKILSCLSFGLGFLMAAFTARRQALHDLLTDTLVVR